jgi:hypothetical protein
MTQDEQILASIEELANKLDELKKTSQSIQKNENIDLSPLAQRLLKIEEKFTLFREDRNKDYSVLGQLSTEVSRISGIIQREHQEVIHRYIEVKKPVNLIIAASIYIIISLGSIGFLIYHNLKLNDDLKTSEANNFKYRYLKVKGEPLSKFANKDFTTTDLIYSIDRYYNKNIEEIQNYVVQKEIDIQNAIEAAEIAKQRSIEAKQAQEEAQKLEEKLNSK